MKIYENAVVSFRRYYMRLVRRILLEIFACIRKHTHTLYLRLSWCELRQHRNRNEYFNDDV